MVRNAGDLPFPSSSVDRFRAGRWILPNDIGAGDLAEKVETMSSVSQRDGRCLRSVKLTRKPVVRDVPNDDNPPARSSLQLIPTRGPQPLKCRSNIDALPREDIMHG